jgi:hypothetical protein
MTKLPLIVAIAGVMFALPASAGDGGNASKPELTLAQLNFCVGPDCRDRDRRYDRDDWRYRRDHDWRYGYGARGCRDVTIRERRPDGDVVVRHERRCG